MKDLYSLYEDISENDKIIISEKLKNLLNYFQDKNKSYVSEFVVVSRTRFFKSISNYGEFLLLQSSSRVISSYEHILRLLHQAKVYLEFVRCLKLNNCSVIDNEKYEEEISKFINYLESKRKKYYYHICQILIKFIVSSLSDNTIDNKFMEKEFDIEEDNIDGYEKNVNDIEIKNEEYNTSYESQRVKDNNNSNYNNNVNIWTINDNDEKIVMEPFDELEEYGNYLYNVLNQMDNKSWKDKNHAEYLKVISLNDAIIKEDNDKNKNSENNNGLTNTSNITNNMILLPKYLENVRNCIYNHQTKSMLEVKSMIEHAMSDNIKAPLFKTGKIVSEMLPSPNYEKYWSTTQPEFSNKIDTSLVQNMIFKFFNLQKNTTPVDNMTPTNYNIKFYDIFKIILKGIYSIKCENEETHIFLNQLLNKTKKKKYPFNYNNQLLDKNVKTDDLYNYLLLPLHLYNNTHEICEGILKYTIYNNDLVLTLKIVDTFLTISVYENSLKDLVHLLNTLAECIILPYLRTEIKQNK